MTDPLIDGWMHTESSEPEFLGTFALRREAARPMSEHSAFRAKGVDENLSGGLSRQADNVRVPVASMDRVLNMGTAVVASYCSVLERTK